MQRKELNEAGLAGRRRSCDEDALARLQHLVLQIFALKQPGVDTRAHLHTVESLGRGAKGVTQR